MNAESRTGLRPLDMLWFLPIGGGSFMPTDDFRAPPQSARQG